MIKKIVLIVLTGFILLVSCTEIYKPTIDPGANALVVEGLITNENGPFTIRLTKASLYNSVKTPTPVEGAKLTLSDNHNQHFTLTNNLNGRYTTPDGFNSKIGDSYTLHIKTSDGNIYESKPQELLPPLSYDSIYGLHTDNPYLGENNQLKFNIGSNILIDIFRTVTKTDSFPLCRFKPVITVQYEYREDIDTLSYWTNKCWRSMPLNVNEDITEDKSHASSAAITGHLLCFTPVLMEGYGLPVPKDLVELHYYLRINQYTINRDTYDFYTEANKQLTTTGKIFDPIASQLKGNLTCTNNSSEIVIGFFEVSSVSHSAITIYQSIGSPGVNMFQVPYIDISDGAVRYKKVKKGVTPEDKDYIDLTPSWWTHL